MKTHQLTVRDTANKAWRWGMLIVIGLQYYGRYRAPSLDPSTLFLQMTPFCAGVFAILTLAVALAEARFSMLFRLLLTVLLAPATALVTYFAAWLGMPAVMSFMAPEHVEHVTVVAVLPELRGKLCAYRLQLAGASVPADLQPCVTHLLWRWARPGDVVKVTCSRGWFGLVVHDVERPAK